MGVGGGCGWVGVAMCVGGWMGGCGCVEGGAQNYNFTHFVIFFSFCRNIALNHFNFHCPAMLFFSPVLLNLMKGLQYYFLFNSISVKP